MLDDETGEALYQRADDTAEALKTRLVRRWVGVRIAGERRRLSHQFALPRREQFRRVHLFVGHFFGKRKGDVLHLHIFRCYSVLASHLVVTCDCGLPAR